jgi:hypothetical protein
MKNNYGPVLLRWKNGVFVPVAAEGSLEKAAAERRAEVLFLNLLDRFNGRQGRNVSDKVGPSYAPALFSKEQEAKTNRVGKDMFASVMARLFSARKIHVEPYGYPSRGTFRIAAGQKPRLPTSCRTTAFTAYRLCVAPPIPPSA